MKKIFAHFAHKNWPLLPASFLFACLFITGQGIAQDGLALLTVEAGARPAGMAGAFVSVSGEANGTFFNPAVGRGSKKFVASFGHNSFLENTRLETGYFIAPFGSKTFVHGGIRFAKIADIEFRNGPSGSPLSLFDAFDVSFKAGVTHDFSDRLSAGISGGWFIEKIADWRGSALNIDLGLLATVSQKISVGGSITNLGSDLTLSRSGAIRSREIPLPLSYRAGLSYRHQEYLGAIDLVIVDDQSHLHFGAERRFQKSFALRAGLMSGYDSRSVTTGASFTRRNLIIDYAFVPFSNDLGTSHLFNLTFEL